MVNYFPAYEPAKGEGAPESMRRGENPHRRELACLAGVTPINQNGLGKSCPGAGFYGTVSSP